VRYCVEKLDKGGHVTLGMGNIVALVCIVISIIFALVTHEATNPTLVGAARDLRCTVVGIEGTVGERLELRRFLRSISSARQSMEHALVFTRD
jgi:hypothetical protein